jgi:hypothetical protein
MIKKISLIGLLFILLSCKKEEQKSIVPAYLRIDQMSVDAVFNTEGTESEKITTVLIYINDNNIPLGAYELPIDFPIAESGPTKIRVEPGMNLNGSKAFRTLYPFYSAYEETMDLVPEQTYYLRANADSTPVCKYTGYLDLIVIDDFESAGLGLESSTASDTSIFKVGLSEGAFQYKNEPTTSGKIVLKPSAAFESISVDEFTYQPLSDFYVELDYKAEVAFQVGVSMDTGNEIIKAPVVTINPNTEWNKIYINLITELGGTVPNTYKVFVRGLNTTNSNKEILIDNLKLVY